MRTRSIAIACVCFMVTLIGAIVPIGSAQTTTDNNRRFDELVRADFFAGIAGDTAAFERAMRLIETTLAGNPRHPEALAWHGSGLLARAALAFQKGETGTGTDLWQRGLKDLDDAVVMAPDNVGVLIPRGATLLELTRTLPDAAEAKRLLTRGVADYEKVLELQAPYFRYLSDHARGELLFGLAEGLHRLGAHDRARPYLKRLVEEARNSEYGSIAAAWLNDPSAVSARKTGCVGCHAK